MPDKMEVSLRQQVLQALKAHPGEWISGGILGARLSLSRTAIWKQVKVLQSQGYDIDSAPRKGYRLSMSADVLSPEEVVPGLRTRSLGKGEYRYYQTTDSTNLQARRLADQGYPEGTVVVAEEQKAGRGRRGRDWYSPAFQGIYVSVILRPVIPIQQFSRLTLLTALALAETLESVLELPARIKWPNDVMVNNRKIAGILAEAVSESDNIDYVVMGIGVNISNLPAEFPAGFRWPATSARAERGAPGSRVQVLQVLLAHLEEYYDRLQVGDFAEIVSRLKDISLVLGREVSFDSGHGLVAGQAVDIDADGFLLVRDAGGKVHKVLSGEINF